MPHVELPQAEFKVVMLGDTNTGKTSLVLRFCEGYYREEARSATVGAFFMTKRLQAFNLTCKIQIWDTAGQAQFRPMAPMYYKNAAAAIVCYDVTSPPSYRVMREWLDELHRNVPAGSIVICMAATKCDLPNHLVSKKEAQQLASSAGALWVETSAKSNTNVTELFRQVAERVLQFREQAKRYNKTDGTIPVTPGASIDEYGRVVKRGSLLVQPQHKEEAELYSSDGVVDSNGRRRRRSSRFGGGSPVAPSQTPSSRRRSSGINARRKTLDLRKNNNDDNNNSDVNPDETLIETTSSDVGDASKMVCEPMMCGVLSTSRENDEQNSKSSGGCAIL